MTFDWLEAVYALVKKGELDEAIDVLFYEVDELSNPDCDEMLLQMDLDRLDVALLIGLLSITLVRKAKLSNRVETFRQVEERFMRDLDPERVVRLLQGLE